MNTKSILRRLLLLPLALSLLTSSLSADTFGKFTYIDNGTSISITDYPQAATDAVVIPATIAGKPVTTIEKDAFYGCYALTSMTIPNSVTSIGENAFIGCNSMTSLTIGSGITSITGSAFAYCNSLPSVTIPNSVTSIGSGAFIGCSSLISVTIPNSVTSIEHSAFSGCSSLTRVTIPTSVTSIGAYTFESCTSLNRVTIPDSVTSIGDDAFARCSSLTSMTVPNNVTSIGFEAFRFCDSLTGVTIGTGVTTIGDRAFSDCVLLAKATFLGNALTLSTFVFSGSSPKFTVYFIKGSTGFTTPTWSGYPTVALPKVPDIAVQQPVGSNMLDGITKKSFGSRPVNFPTAPRVFTISNTGTGTIRAMAITEDGTNAGDFIVGSLSKTVLVPGASTTFTVTFKPTATGTRNAAIHIGSNDPDENPFDILLTGLGT